MKYLLIFLFLFSTHSFSGEIDGKGIECIVKLTKKDAKKNINMWWFNYGKADIVTANYPRSKTLSEAVWTYTTTANTVKWKLPGTKVVYILNRKTLKYEVRDYNKPKLEELGAIGTCRVLTGFEEVLKKQEEYKKEDEERKRKAKEAERKAREGNKI